MAAYPTIQANGVTLPSPDELKIADEIIWSANTGRSTTGKMIGDVVAEKQTIDIQWGVITYAEYKKIRANIKSGFHPFKLVLGGETITITAYRGTLSAGAVIHAGSATYIKGASVTIIQQ
ncbi:MAG: hypothetical protein IJV14_15460 [Lachnospiraceae bacterium]|nr:hypothetical protein [Lachnospiraceae bacterium]